MGNSGPFSAGDISEAPLPNTGLDILCGLGIPLVLIALIGLIGLALPPAADAGGAVDSAAAVTALVEMIGMADTVSLAAPV